MLAELQIRNLAVVESLRVELDPGLVVFTGDTGAGKSLLVHAVELLVGGRSDTSVVRTEATSAWIEGIFQWRTGLPSVVRQLLEQEELLDDPEQLVLAREVRGDGRTVARINGRAVRLGFLRQIGELLVDIHGQSEHLSLLEPRFQREVLDCYAGLQDLVQQYQQCYRSARQLVEELTRLREQACALEREADLLRYQLREIEQARLEPGEEEELLQERRRLVHARKLAELSQQCLSLLQEGLGGQDSTIDLLAAARRTLLEMARMDPVHQEFIQRVESLQEEVTEIARQLSAYGQRLEQDPERLEEVESRLELIQRLKRKYGNSVEEIQAYASQLRARLSELEQTGDRAPKLTQVLNTTVEQASALLRKITQGRTQAAGELSRAVERELAHLGFPYARFHVLLQEDAQHLRLPTTGEAFPGGPFGAETVEFLLSANPGEAPKPLRSVASGGETSRMMLALKVVLSGADPVPTLVFDELDQGVGAPAGFVVGQKLRQLASKHQVLCITHLAQIAAFADQHFQVQKHWRQHRTVTEVRLLSEDERLQELARMFGSLSRANLEAARELLDQARALSH